MRKIASLLSVLMLLCTLAFGQTRTVTGTVTDEAGTPIPFATITETGTNNATTADANGKYSITLKQNSRLTISSSGFQTQTATPTGNEFSFRLSRGGQLDEVVVTSMGIRRTEKALGYSVSKVDPNSITQKSEPDLLKNLQGKVPGVDIRTSQGTPGAATRIQIRGNSSFGLETQPLIVVDGVPYSNDQITTSSQTTGGTAYGSGIANLDPNDIETFTVLKGAAAASLYGSRASRGVILITTKSGSAKKGAKPINVNFRSSFSVEKIASLPDYQNDYGTGAQFLYSNSNGSWGPRFGQGKVYSGGGATLRPSPSGVDSVPAWPEYLAAYPELFAKNGNMAYVPQPNNVKDLFGNGQVYENSISVNGGGATSSVALTASNLVHEGYVYNTSYTKNNIGIGGQTTYNKLTVGGNFSYARSRQKGGFFGENQGQGATSQFARSLFLGRNWDLNLPFQDALGKPLIPNGGAQFDNPHWAARNNVATTIEERFLAGLRLGYKFNNWANLSYNLGVNTHTLGRDEIIQEFSRAANGLGQIIEDNFHAQELQSTVVLAFNPKIANDFTLDFKVGNDINQRVTRRQANTGLDFVVPKIYNLINTATQSFSADRRTRRRIVGFFTDATLGYKNFAFLNASIRNDRTSTLPFEDAAYSFYYPGVSGSLVFTDALKIKSNWLDYGKVRAGWARVGNDAPPNNGQDVYVINPNFLSQPSTSLNSQTVDPALTPEFTQELELGLDLSLFKRKAMLDVTVYDKTTTDLIYGIDVPSSTGYGSFNTNIGEISNKGIEIGLTVRPITNADFNWEIRGAFTKNKNIVEKLVEGLERAPLTASGGSVGFSNGIQAYIEAGKPFGYLYGPKTDRLEDGTPLINPATGMMIEALEAGEIGNPTPDYKMGITNTISYKGFVLSGLFDLTKGGDIYSVTVSSLLGRGVTEDTKDREANWVIPGVYGDPNTHLPIMVGGKTVPNQTRISTNDLYFAPGGASATFAINASEEANVYDATVYRLRELSLGYELPKSVTARLKVTALRLSLTGHNIWYLAPNIPKHTKFDPEVNSYGSTSVQGIEFSAAPTTRRIGINLNVTF